MLSHRNGLPERAAQTSRKNCLHAQMDRLQINGQLIAIEQAALREQTVHVRLLERATRGRLTFDGDDVVEKRCVARTVRGAKNPPAPRKQAASW